MSYREMRSFTEKMRSLGYPRTISMESFRLPNFEAMASILLWLIRSYDPSIDMPDNIDSEQDRVALIKSAAALMAPKAHIKLNTRKLYMADGNCVRELLKIVHVLHDANEEQAKKAEDTSNIPPLDISCRLSQLKACRMLASEITEHGAKLFDLLGKEIVLKDVRTAVISRPFELRDMETSVNSAIGKLTDQISSTRTGSDNLAADEGNLLSKIEKKKVELERAQKRLQSLQSVRPAYMDEYERIEADLTKLYGTYIERFRNLTYLEQQLDEYNRQEQGKLEETEESLKRIQSRLRDEEMRLLRGDKEMRSALGSSYLGEDTGGRLARPKAAGQRSRSLQNVSDSGSEDDVQISGHEDDLSIAATDMDEEDGIQKDFMEGEGEADEGDEGDDGFDDQADEEDEDEEGLDFEDDDALPGGDGASEDDNDF